MKIKILQSAKDDLKTGYLFYEQQQHGIGRYFLQALSTDIDSLLLFAGIHEIHFNTYYRMLSKRFPFAIYYKIKDMEVQIYAIIDCRRKPAWVREKLQ